MIEKESYVDDFTSGAHTVEEAKEKQHELIELLNIAGLSLKKWASNSQELEDWLPKSDLIRESSLFESSESTSILGISWSPSGDYFHFKIALESFETSKLTKRKIFATIAKLFDPIGWLASVIIAAKIFMQALWLLRCGWDDLLPIEYTNHWYEFYTQLNSLVS